MPGNQQSRLSHRGSLRSFLDRSQFGVALSRPDGTLHHANAALCRMLGYTEAELRLTSIARLTYQPDLHLSRESLRRLLAGEVDSFSLIQRVVRKDGSLLRVVIQATLERDAGAAPDYLVLELVELGEPGTAVEETTTDAFDDSADIALRQDALRLGLAAESGQVGLWEVELATGAVYLSAEWKRQLGYEDHEVSNSFADWADRIHPDDRERILSVQQSCLDGDASSYAYEMRLRHKDGTYRTILSRGRIFRDESGKALRVMGSHVDLSEHRQAEAGLRDSEERFRQLAGSIREVFWLTDVSKRRILYVSPGYEEIWGRTCESLYANPMEWLDAIHPEDRERVTLSAGTRQEGGTYDEEYRILRPDGAVRWIRDRGFPVRDAAGQVSGVAGVADDITERRSLEAQLHQTQKMESVGLLAGGVAHDFNNLLTVISGNTELLLEEVASDDSSRQLVEDIQRAAQRATALTRQLLAFSRRQVLDPRIVDLNTIVADTERMLHRILGEDVTLLTVLPGGLPSVLVDPGHLVQVLMNLAVNARDAMPRGGSLTVTTRLVDPSPQLSTGRLVALAVTDTGTGMTADVKARIFEPFFTTKGIGQGTGLGLSVVQGIVSQSGGSIEVQSDVGRGTTFTIHLPATDVASTETPGQAAIAPAHGTEVILLVEDDEGVSRYARRVLETGGYTVNCSRSGAEALERLAPAEVRIDLLVTDVVMPGMSGRELAETLRLSRPTLKVLFTSGYTDDAVVRHGVLRSEVSFLQKPYPPQELLRSVREVLDQPVVLAVTP